VFIEQCLSGAAFATLLALLIAVCWPGYLEAAEQFPTDLTELSLEELMEIKIDIVYGASKYVQKVTEAPSSVSIVTADEIKKYGYRTLADILQSVRSFYTTYDRNYDFVGVRGFGRPGDYNIRLLLLVDGHRVNNNIDDCAFIGTEFVVDVDLIDRVEVIRGPSSSLYGTNAFFGVINVITKRGRALNGPEISGEAASFGMYKGRLGYGNQFQNGLEIMLSGSIYDSKGQDVYSEEFDDPSTNNGVAENCDDGQYKSFFGELSFRDLALQGGYVSREKGIPTASFETEFNDPRTRTVDEQAYVNLKYEHSFDDQSEVMARLSYNRYDYDGDYVYDYSEEEDDEPYIVVNKDVMRGRWWGGELKLTKKLIEKHTLVLGAEYRDNSHQDQRNYDEEVYLDDKRDSKNWALYVQDEFQILNPLIFNAGLRHDHYETFGGTTNPRLALIYTPIEKTSLKFLYGQAFRAPNAYELYYDDAEETQKSEPDSLGPETIKTYEVIIEQYIGRHLRGSVAGFYYEIGSLIGQQTDPTDDLLVFKNLEEVEAKGLELELEGKWDSGLKGRVSYTFQKAEDRQTGDVLSNSPKHLAKFNVGVPLIKEKLFAGMEAQYMSTRRTLADKDADAFWLTNLTLSSTKLLKGLGVSASVYNLFDKKYGDPGSGEHLQDVIEQDGRSVRLQLTYAFQSDPAY